MAVVQAPGETDVWGFYDLDCGREIRADWPRSFLYLLCSPSTSIVELIGEGGGMVSERDKKVRVKIKGPACEDGNRLWAEIALTKDLLSDPVLGLNEDEQRALYNAVHAFLSKKGVYMINVLSRFRLALGLPGRVK